MSKDFFEISVKTHFVVSLNLGEIDLIKTNHAQLEITINGIV